MAQNKGRAAGKTAGIEGRQRRVALTEEDLLGLQGQRLCNHHAERFHCAAAVVVEGHIDKDAAILGDAHFRSGKVDNARIVSVQMSAAGDGAAAAVTAAGSIEDGVFFPPLDPMEQFASLFEAFLNADGAEGLVDADIDVAGMGDVFEPQLQRIQSEPACGHVEIVLKKERELGAGPAAKCTGNGGVGDDGAAGVSHVWVVVAAEEFVCHGSAVVFGVAEVCPGVERVVSLHAHQSAVGGVEPLDLNIHRRAADGGGEHLLAGEHKLHRSLPVERGGCGHRLGDPLLFGSE